MNNDWLGVSSGKRSWLPLSNSAVSTVRLFDIVYMLGNLRGGLVSQKNIKVSCSELMLFV